MIVRRNGAYPLGPGESGGERSDVPRTRGGAILAAAGLAALALAGCTGSTQASGVSVISTCRQLGAVLSDGPDPNADPVGYAEAQILPLRRIVTSDGALRAALGDLAGAYQAYFTTGGSAEAEAAVDRASSRIDAICPGATS